MSSGQRNNSDMTDIFVNSMLFFYILSFFSGVVHITLNTISAARLKTKLQIRMAWLNGSFFIFILMNFILFFNRLFVLRQVVHNMLLVAFDLSYAILVWFWGGYLIELRSKKPKQIVKILFLLAVMVYAIIWLVLDLVSLNNDNQQIDSNWGKALAAVAEILMFAAAMGFTWWSFMTFKNKHVLRFLICFSMSVYFLWFFLYDMDCVFRFIGPKAWKIYPFDAVILIYFVFNILMILCHYSAMWREPGVNDRQQAARDMEQLILEEINIHETLTKREKEVLQLMINGKNNAQIAEILVISIYTVKRHINNIFKKTTIKSRTDLTLFIARKTGR